MYLYSMIKALPFLLLLDVVLLFEHKWDHKASDNHPILSHPQYKAAVVGPPRKPPTARPPLPGQSGQSLALGGNHPPIHHVVLPTKKSEIPLTTTSRLKVALLVHHDEVSENDSGGDDQSQERGSKEGGSKCPTAKNPKCGKARPKGEPRPRRASEVHIQHQAEPAIVDAELRATPAAWLPPGMTETPTVEPKRVILLHNAGKAHSEALAPHHEDHDISVQTLMHELRPLEQHDEHDEHHESHHNKMIVVNDQKGAKKLPPSVPESYIVGNEEGREFGRINEYEGHHGGHHGGHYGGVDESHHQGHHGGGHEGGHHGDYHGYLDDDHEEANVHGLIVVTRTRAPFEPPPNVTTILPPIYLLPHDEAGHHVHGHHGDSRTNDTGGVQGGASKSAPNTINTDTKTTNNTATTTKPNIRTPPASAKPEAVLLVAEDHHGEDYHDEHHDNYIESHYDDAMVITRPPGPPSRPPNPQSRPPNPQSRFQNPPSRPPNLPPTPSGEAANGPMNNVMVQAHISDNMPAATYGPAAMAAINDMPATIEPDAMAAFPKPTMSNMNMGGGVPKPTLSNMNISAVVIDEHHEEDEHYEDQHHENEHHDEIAVLGPENRTGGPPAPGTGRGGKRERKRRKERRSKKKRHRGRDLRRRGYKNRRDPEEIMEEVVTLSKGGDVTIPTTSKIVYVDPNDVPHRMQPRQYFTEHHGGPHDVDDHQASIIQVVVSPNASSGINATEQKLLVHHQFGEDEDWDHHRFQPRHHGGEHHGGEHHGGGHHGGGHHGGEHHGGEHHGGEHHEGPLHILVLPQTTTVPPTITVRTDPPTPLIITSTETPTAAPLRMTSNNNLTAPRNITGNNLSNNTRQILVLHEDEDEHHEDDEHHDEEEHDEDHLLVPPRRHELMQRDDENPPTLTPGSNQDDNGQQGAMLVHHKEDGHAHHQHHLLIKPRTHDLLERDDNTQYGNGQTTPSAATSVWITENSTQQMLLVAAEDHHEAPHHEAPHDPHHEDDHEGEDPEIDVLHVMAVTPTDAARNGSAKLYTTTDTIVIHHDQMPHLEDNDIPHEPSHHGTGEHFKGAHMEHQGHIDAAHDTHHEEHHLLDPIETQQRQQPRTRDDLLSKTMMKRVLRNLKRSSKQRGKKRTNAAKNKLLQLLRKRHLAKEVVNRLLKK